MEGSIPTGAYVVLKRTTLEEVRNGGEYLVVGGSKALIRRVYMRHDSRSLRLEAADENCPVERIPKDKVAEVYEVCGVIEGRRESLASRQRKRGGEE